ncbi:MAG: EamA family transporter [Desulforhopalus sp.]
MLFFDNIALTGAPLLGDMLILLAVLIWGCHVVYIKKIIAEFHPIQVTLYPISMAAPMFLLNGFLWDGEMVRFIDASIIKAMLYQTFVTASFGLVAWNIMIKIRRYRTSFLCFHHADFRSISWCHPVG